MTEIISDRELLRRVGNGERPSARKIGTDRWMIEPPKCDTCGKSIGGTGYYGPACECDRKRGKAGLGASVGTRG